MSDATPAPRIRRDARLRWDTREQKFLLLYPERGLLLNAAAHAVVELCDGEHSPENMAEALAARYAPGNPAELLPFVRSFLDRLRGLGLIENAEKSWS